MVTWNKFATKRVEGTELEVMFMCICKGRGYLRPYPVINFFEENL